MLQIHEFKETLLNHRIQSSGPIPTILDSEGVYPYESYVETAERPDLKEYQMVVMENRFISIKVCPDLGGKVYSITDKKSGREVLYDSGAVRPVRILPRMAFISGGIEVSFPISHTPVQIEQVQYKWEQIDNRLYLWCGEREISSGMHWTVEYSIGESDAFLTQRALFYNSTSKKQPWMSWSNAAVPAREDSLLHFPKGQVLCHSDQLTTIQWDSEKYGLLKQHDRMSGYFWEKPECNAFGVYTPSLGCGLYHIADSKQVPGIKLWTYGIGRDERWAHVSSLGENSYIEIQAGPIVDQSIKEELEPGEHHVHTEYWIPSAVPLTIEEIDLPQVQLIPPNVIPQFEWIERRKVTPWMNLLQVYESQNKNDIPPAPSLVENIWPPSGMEDLGDALNWAISVTENEENEVWRYYFGVWQAGTGQFEKALEVLKNVSIDWARLVEARILIHAHNSCQEAVKTLKQIKSVSLSLHPQVVIERDIALSHLGEIALAERKMWLDQVASLEDEELIERKISLLYDSGQYEEAHELLESRSFSLVHQRYERSKLWLDLQKKLGKKIDKEFPGSLGEDRLAAFGQYRVFEG
ncbi:DUF5107 domain-containing protein [Bacillus sp. M6-12]|uniref:DUF5107 domain-containing protein n=1 Tax=Bacillus sp. M6-12 TaxID=2054166 RepID=UPI000C7765A9|nr:DUF5107 domain-containing protein [Bacillus sp. M6-12]PLS18754.1 DUF5107 domain-containing protein [Bacillus sp. M6-12]